MKGKDLKTLESLLKEYGMSSGTSTPVGQQSSGSSAKASAANRVSKSSINKPSQSPTTQKTSQAKPQEPAKPVIAKAKELEQDFEFPDDKGNVVKVVSPMGQGLNKDAVIVQNQKNKEFYTLQPEDNIALPQVDQEEIATEDNNPLSKIKSHKLRTGKKGQHSIKLGRKVRKLSKLIRKHKLSEAPLFEINFNDPKLAKSALASPISCGFEAETVWTDVDGEEMDLNDMSANEIYELVMDQEGTGAVESIDEGFREWLMESDLFFEVESEVIQDLVNDRKEDEAYIDDFVSDNINMDEVEDYKQATLDELDDDDKEEYEDWDDDAWARQYVEETQQEKYEEWLADSIRDNGEQWDETWDIVNGRYDWADYVRMAYNGNWYDMLGDHEIWINTEGGSLSGVGEEMELWTEKNSTSKGVRTGDYHSGYGDTDQDYWRVESDPSIEGNGVGAEIISPVYSTPEKMLVEMKSLFEYMYNNDVETNSSTGLHITMSWEGEEGATLNKLKMALLLGDRYVAKQFDRENSNYSQSQYQKIQQYLDKLQTNINDEKSLEGLETILNKGVSPDKYNTIHFKNMTNANGNNLIEFRVAGGEDYHSDYNKLVKTVIRYAAVMQAGHDTTAYRKDYVRALFRAINGSADIKTSPEIQQNLPDHTIVDVLKDMYSKKYYTDGLEAISIAFSALNNAMRIKGNSKQGELFDEAEGNEGWREILNHAQQNFASAIGMLAVDAYSGKLRSKINARSINALRKALKDFNLNYEALWKKFQNTLMYTNLTKENKILTHNKLKAAFDQLFKASVGTELKAAFTLPGNNKNTVYLINDKLYQELLDANIIGEWGPARFPWDDRDNDDNREKPDVNADSIHSVPQDEWKNIKQTVYDYNDYVDELKRLQKQSNEMDDETKNSTEPHFVRYREDLANTIKDLKSKVVKYKQPLDAFQKKYGFVPPSIRTNSEGINYDLKQLTTSQLKDLANAYDIGVEVIESTTYDRIAKLSLEEQLKLVSKIDGDKLNEAWSKKYKDSINCSNPKGFSQKAHCAGKKKKTDEAWFKKKEKVKVRQTDPVKVIMNIASSGKEWPVRMNDGNHVVVTPDIAKVIARRYYASNTFKDMIAKAVKSVESFSDAIKNLKPVPVKEGAVPNNDRAKKIQEILSKPLLASDLRGQMYAYIAVPDPSMIRAFRQARAQGGDNMDLREVFKTFANSVHPTIKKQAGLKESTIKEAPADQERLKFIVDQLKKNPAFISRVYRFIKTDVANADRVHPLDYLTPDKTTPEKDYAYKGVLDEFVKAIMNTEGDFDDIEEFLKTYGKVSYVNTKVLMADGYSTWDEWLQGSGKVSKEFISSLYDNMFNIALNIEGSNRGPGEVGLALLAPNITFASVGDLKIDGEEVEVKGEKSSGGGRLKNSNADYGQPNLDAVYDKFKIPNEARPQRLPAGNAGSRAGTHFLDIAQQLDAAAKGAGEAYIKELFVGTFKYGDKAMIDYMIKNYSKMDRAQASELAQEISYSSYANILKQKEFDMFLFLKAPGKKSLAFQVDNYKNHLDKFKLGSLDWGDKQNGPAVQVSMR